MKTINELKEKEEYDNYIKSLEDDLIVWSIELELGFTENIDTIIKDMIKNRITFSSLIMKILN
jgi:hypothetical protein